MGAIDDLNSTLTKFSEGLADAKSALESKGVSTTDLTITNLGAKIRTITSAATYVFSASNTSVLFQASAVDTANMITVTSTKLESGVTSDVTWTFSEDIGASTYFNTGKALISSHLTVGPKGKNLSAVDRVGVVTLTQANSGKTVKITVTQKAYGVDIEENIAVEESVAIEEIP